VGYILAQLHIAQHRQRRHGKRRRQRGIEDRMIDFVFGSRAHPTTSAGMSCVLANICAM